ncbi:MAG: SpoIIE family protein phosphatase [Bacteroidia bacterium]|nr:SpoIIE family protein phosphatase [Bacteroidia bacterium]
MGSKEDSGDTRFTEHCYAYGNDDILYLFTDGFSDQFGAEGKKKMGSKLFRTNLIQVKDLPMNLQKTKMEELLENWQGNAKQTDDITLLGIRL